MGQSWVVRNKHEAESLCDYVMDQYTHGKEVTYSIKGNKRSGAQNAALHSMFRRLATQLNDAGFGIPHPFKKELEIPWTEVSTKELLYKPIVISMFGTDTSTALTKEELTHSVEVLLGRLAEITGVIAGFSLQENEVLNAN